MKMYVTRLIYPTKQIEVIDVEKKTKKSVFIEGRIRPIYSMDYECYFDTFEEAKSFLIERARLLFESSYRRLEKAKDYNKIFNCLK